KESYQQGERLKVYIVEVRNTPRGPQVVVSRTHPGLLKRLLELEVPEIYDGIVVIRQIAREAGIRSKVAVSATDPNVDPVGACVGPRGIRVQKIVTELKGEKIDVVEWRESPEEYIANALSPAKVLGVRINAVVKAAMVIVPDNQLSLAIGRAGQNARLAAKLTGWKIDIKSESQALELPKVEELEATKSTGPVVEEREDLAMPEEMAGEHGEQNAPGEQGALEEERAEKQEEQNASEEEQSAPEKVVGEEGAKEGTTPYSEDEGKSKVKKKQKKKGIADDAKILEEEDEAEASRKKVKRRPKMKRKREELLEDEEEDDYF
ncbi:MAG TPA: transcription termination factor NusA, partial [Firmicutes bacterium]|nr:transcription termination factor NusA [Bacillota bacterium]